jgi:hypothetical protein
VRSLHSTVTAELRCVAAAVHFGPGGSRGVSDRSHAVSIVDTVAVYATDPAGGVRARVSMTGGALTP